MFQAYKNSTRPVLAALAFVTAGVFLSGTGVAEPQSGARVCGAQVEIEKVLYKSYGEEELFGGVVRDGVLTVMYGYLSTGTWTIVQASNPKQACAVVAGQALKISDDARHVDGITDLGGAIAVAVEQDETRTLTITHKQGIMSFTSIMTGEGWRYASRRLPEA